MIPGSSSPLATYYKEQEVYQIVVEDPEEQVVWKTDKVEDSASINIQYGGEELKSTTRYEWTVIVWEQNR
ncbi:hypothetical protein ACTNEO_02385 [Gracilibacillus sp. HCP3S3_G5_1]|uniref:glycoside hydrolase family 78 protein n=1 Tax=unclassified Gracilibacillus TaxID=2625209 RepID=UPI003F8B9760